MRTSKENVQKELSELMDCYTGAMKRVVTAYAERRTKERDVRWVALQATKEFGAMRLHSWSMWKKAKEMADLNDIRKSSEDSFEGEASSALPMKGATRAPLIAMRSKQLVSLFL